MDEKTVIEQIEVNLVVASRRLREYAETLEHAGAPTPENFVQRLLKLTEHTQKAANMVHDVSKLKISLLDLNIQAEGQAEAWRQAEDARNKQSKNIDEILNIVKTLAVKGSPDHPQNVVGQSGQDAEGEPVECAFDEDEKGVIRYD